MRDSSARLKLLGALLRLNAERSEGFTAIELGGAADVELETARHFLKTEKDYVEISGQRAAAGKGRPGNVYTLSISGKQKLIGDIAFIGQTLRPPEEGDPFRSLGQLGETIEDFVEAIGDEREEYREIAEQELKGCRTEFKYLREAHSPYVSEFGLRLETLEQRLRDNSTTQGIARYDAEETHFVDWVVSRYGSWTTAHTSAIEPVVMLFDGIEGRDRLTEKVVETYLKEHVPVATFEVAGMAQHVREELFDCVGLLRRTTPLIACDIVMTVDSKTPIGRTLMLELKTHARPSRTGSRREIIDPNNEQVRLRYIERVAALVHSPEPRIRDFALRCTLALSAVERAEVSASFGPKPKRALSTLGASVQTAIGDTVCVDLQFNQLSKKKFEKSDVIYTKAIDRKRLSRTI